MYKFKKYYNTVLVPDLMLKLGIQDPNRVPKIKRIVINTGIKGGALDRKKLINAMSVLSIITGQRPSVTRARKSLASFKLKRGMPIGCKVSLSGDPMLRFIELLSNVILPSYRDFSGLKSSYFDKKGNLSFGLSNIVVTPDIVKESEKLPDVLGVDITIITTARSDFEGKVLISSYQLPFLK